MRTIGTEADMEKYGVDTESADKDEKSAADKTHCHKCGNALRSSETTNVRLCPVCGTKPFEEK